MTADDDGDDLGWPLPVLRVTHRFLIRNYAEVVRYDSWEGENVYPPEVTSTQILWQPLIYDCLVVATLTAGSFLFFLPWQAFPRPQLSLADLFVGMTSATVGCVLWYQLCVSGTYHTEYNRLVLTMDSVSYLALTLASAGILNGMIASASAWMRRRGAVGN